MKPTDEKSPKKVAVFGCKHTTRDLIAGLAKLGFSVDRCVTIDPTEGKRQKVAGYMDLQEFLSRRTIPCTTVSTYSLKSENDKVNLLGLKLDLVLVMGWQRLLPDWLLNSLSIGAFGMHGSSKPLPHGRGRSPLNWSLIQDKKVFYTHLFRYLPGVDNGPVVGVQKFDITPFDTCHTLHFKNLLSMIRLCGEHLPKLIAGTANLTPQPTDGASYYPKRTAEDGIIYWDSSTLEIYNLVRAVTKPFPGAFGYLDDDPEKKLFIWRAIPFDTQLTWPDATPGEILEVFYDGSFVVKTGDASLLVLDHEGCTLSENDVGRHLGHLMQPKRVFEDLPD
ncbi:MAG: formyltransferase family protein [Planctomycetota bacterium]